MIPAEQTKILCFPAVKEMNPVTREQLGPAPPDHQNYNDSAPPPMKTVD